MDRKKYAKELSRKMEIYSVIHFLVLSLFQQYLFHHRHLISDLVFYGCCSYIVISVTSLGLLFGENQLFPWLEMGRCLLFLFYSSEVIFTQNVLLMTLLLWIIRVFYFYSAWLAKTKCVDMISIRNKLKIQ
jgi:hypothetical protein